MRHGGGARSASAAFSAQNTSENEYRQRRLSVTEKSRKKRFAERSLWAAQPHEGVSEPAVDTCCLISAVAIRKAPASPNDCRSPVWNTGCLCGNECCRSCRSKNTRLAQCYQHGSTTERKIWLCVGRDVDRASVSTLWAVDTTARRANQRRFHHQGCAAALARFQ